MNLNLKKVGEITVMQASGSPGEIAEFLTAANLIEIPLVVCEDEDVLFDLDVSDAVAQ